MNAKQAADYICLLVTRERNNGRKFPLKEIEETINAIIQESEHQRDKWEQIAEELENDRDKFERGRNDDARCTLRRVGSNSTVAVISPTLAQNYL